MMMKMLRQYRKLCAVIALAGCCNALFAVDNINNLIHQQIQYRDQLKNAFQSEAKEMRAISNQRIDEIKPEIKNIEAMSNTSLQQHGFLNVASANTDNKDLPDAMIFISWSMPKELLAQTIEDGYRYHIPVVLRGLINQSFEETAKAFFGLVKEKNKGGVMINPMWFRELNITTVPALAVIKKGAFCPVKSNCSLVQDADVVFGNIPIQKGLEMIASNGTVAKTEAKQLLERGDV